MNKANEDTDKCFFMALRSGQESAFEQLFRRYYVSLCEYAYMFLGSTVEAEDVVQDLFLYLWHGHEQVVIDKSVKSYLFTAVRFRALNVLKHRLMARRHAALLTEFIENMQHSEYSEDEIVQIERIKLVLETLPGQCRTVFSMSCLEGKKYKEIAEELGISVNTVKSHIIKAYRLIRANLGQNAHPLLLLIGIQKLNKNN